jgi:integrase
MARRPRAARLETRTARLRLAIRKRPYDWTAISPGISLGYRRCEGAGRWVVRVAAGGSRWEKNVGIADDHEAADGENVLNFHEAMDKARALARGKDAVSGRPATLSEAIDDYKADLIARRGSTQNASRIRFHMTATLLSKPVSMLTSRELRHWRDSLIADGMIPSSLLRLVKSVRACLNLAARHDKRITNKDAWGDSLGGITEHHNPRNVILPDEQIAAIVAAAYAVVDAAFGLYCETMAATGQRQSQLAKLEIGDLLDGNGAPRLMVPSSRKGRNRRVERKSIAITRDLAAKLRAAAGDRAPTAPLLLRADGKQWQPLNSDHLRPFAMVAESAGVACTMYALRHSSIVRQLLVNTPIRLVADHHDTSVQMIEKTYSRYIATHGDALVRRGLIDLSQPAAANVVPLPSGRRS